jgi:hypothetical protein
MPTEDIRLCVAALKSLPKDMEIGQFVGVPDEIAGVGWRAPLQAPDALMIVRNRDAFYLLRYLSSGEEVGDTWHQTIDEAKRQADLEYEGCVGRWLEIPDDMASEDEIVTFALSMGP